MGNSNGKIFAPVRVVEDIAYVLGTNSGDLGTNCASNLVKKYALYKPIRHPNLSHVTLTERAAKFHGFEPEELDSIKTCFFGQDGSINGTPFSTVPLPTPWTYIKPNGTIGTAPYRALDFAHIESDLTKIATDWGYNHNAKSFLSFAREENVTFADNKVAIDVGSTKFPFDIGNFIFSQDGSSMHSSGNTANIEIYLDMLKPYTAFPTLGMTEPFFLEGASGRTPISGATWQFAIAIAMKIPVENKYAWLIVSSEEPFGDWWLEETWSWQDILDHHICFGEDMAAGTLQSIRNFVQRGGQTDFICVPFLAQNLKYNSTNGRWYFEAGNSQNKVLTFPDGDYFVANFTGITTTLRINIVGTPQTRYYTVGGQNYQITGVTSAVYTGFVMQIPVPASASTEGTFTLPFKLEAYGRNVDFQAGIMETTTGNITVKNASGQVITPPVEIGATGQSAFEAYGTIIFSTTAISSIIAALSLSVNTFQTAITLKFQNADNLLVVKQNFPLLINILRS